MYILAIRIKLLENVTGHEKTGLSTQNTPIHIKTHDSESRGQEEAAVHDE